jgi:SpoIID/LytB domain protein
VFARFLVAALMALAPAAGGTTHAQVAVPVVVIDGKGFGHGVGMAQEGAHDMATSGASLEQILGQFYPGTGLGKARGPVRVPVLDAGPAPTAVDLSFPDGGEMREAGSGPVTPGFPVKVAPGGSARVTWDGGRYRVLVAGGPVALGPMRTIAAVRPQIPTQVPTIPTTSAPPPPPDAATTTTTSAPPSSTTTTTSPVASPTTAAPGAGATTTTTAPAPPPPAGDQPPPDDSGPPTSARSILAVPATNGTVAVPARQRRYRGTIEATGASGTLRLVNTLDVEQYLKGMGEVPGSWPQAALRAQAVAARTYAMRAMTAGGEICDTQRCQVYLGAQAENPAMNAAVDATAQQVLVYRNALASAVYSANGGGFSASREEGFGVADDAAPYLRAAPYPTQDPGPWSVTVALTDVAGRLGYAGQITDVRIARAGPSGRALEVVLDGSAGPKSVTGIAFDAALGLRSTLFTVRIDTGPPPPPPPAEDATLQALPDDAPAAAATEVAAAPPSTAAPVRPATKRPVRQRHTLPDPRELVVLSWVTLAAGGAAGLFLSRPGGPWSRRRPSPSAPRTEDGSP